MRSRPCAASGRRLLLWLTTAGLRAAAASSREFHQGHEAEHRIALRRRHGRRRLAREGRVQVEVGVHTQRVINATTELQDMASEYTGYIGVGTGRAGGPAFTARVVFDTGSTNLWVASALCTAAPCGAGGGARRFYDPKASLSQEPYLPDGQSPGGGEIDVRFGTGELKGPLHVDTYRVGPILVERQPFAMIREMSGEVFESFPFEGILGLGFRSLSFAGIDPFFDRVIEQGLLKNNEFAFYLNADTSQPSFLLWGGIDKDLYEPPIHMFPVVQAHYWALELLDVKLGNASLAAGSGPAKRAKRVIIDSGTTYFTAPSDLYRNIVERIPEADCSAVDGYAPMVYVLRTVSGQLFHLAVTQSTYMISDEVGEICHPAFMKLDVDERYGPAMILGEVFMRRFFTVFSRGDGSPEQARIGIAHAKIGARPKVTPRRRRHARRQDAGALVRREAARHPRA